MSFTECFCFAAAVAGHILQPRTTCSPGKAALNTGHSGKRQKDSQACKFYHLHLFIHILEAPLYATLTLLDALIRLCKPPVLMRSKKGSTLSLCCASFFQVDSQHWHYSVFQDSCSSDEQLPSNTTKAVAKRKTVACLHYSLTWCIYRNMALNADASPEGCQACHQTEANHLQTKRGSNYPWLGQKPSPQHMGKGCCPEPGKTWGWVGPVSPPPLPLLVFTAWWVLCTETGSWGKSAHY